MIFLDSSVLVRRYGGRRRGIRPAPASPAAADRYCVSELSRVEFLSAMERRVREGTLERSTAEEAIAAFTRELPLFHRVPLDEDVLRTATDLVRRRPLRSLDALHLASAMVIAKDAPVPFRFASADARLNEAAKAEGLEVVATT